MKTTTMWNSLAKVDRAGEFRPWDWYAKRFKFGVKVTEPLDVIIIPSVICQWVQNYKNKSDIHRKKRKKRKGVNEHLDETEVVITLKQNIITIKCFM